MRSETLIFNQALERLRGAAWSLIKQRINLPSQELNLYALNSGREIAILLKLFCQAPRWFQTAHPTGADMKLDKLLLALQQVR
jgi:hypothetical protein